MNIDLVEIENKNSELFFNIINKDNNDIVQDKIVIIRK